MKKLIGLITLCFLFVFCLELTSAYALIKDETGTKQTKKEVVKLTNAFVENIAVTQYFTGHEFAAPALKEFTISLHKSLITTKNSLIHSPLALVKAPQLPDNLLTHGRARNSNKYDNRLNSHWRIWQESNLNDKIIV
jgi:hypothetical protein